MIEENNTLKKKIIIILSVTLIVAVISLIIWLLFFNEEKKDYNGSWILKEIKPIDGTFKTADKNIKIIVTNNKNVTLYENNIEKCKMIIGQNMTCFENTFDIVDNAPIGSLYLTDQNDSVYKFVSEKNGDTVLKQGFSITITNWKIEEKNGTIGHSSIEELNNRNNNYIEKDEETTITVPINVHISSPGEYIKYSFEMVNDGTEDLYISSSDIGYSSNENISIDEVEAIINCYTDENHIYYIESEPTPFESGNKLLCNFNIKNNTISNPTDITISQSWIITKNN